MGLTASPHQVGKEENLQACNSGTAIAMHSPAPVTGNATAGGSRGFKIHKGDLAKHLCPFCVSTHRAHADNDKQKNNCGKRKRTAANDGSARGVQIGWHHAHGKCMYYCKWSQLLQVVPTIAGKCQEIGRLGAEWHFCLDIRSHAHVGRSTWKKNSVGSV
jgi:hypothetical protein